MGEIPTRFLKPPDALLFELVFVDHSMIPAFALMR
jgi:hypothetical protein